MIKLQRCAFILIVLILITMLSGCFASRNFVYKSPDSFAEFTKEKQYFKAISSDGIRLKVYSIENDPFGDIKMWNDAVSFYLSNIGYHPDLNKDITTSENLKGKYSEYRYLYNGENYLYALAIFVDEKNIYIIEAGGTEASYKQKREAVIKSISGFSTKQ